MKQKILHIIVLGAAVTVTLVNQEFPKKLAAALTTDKINSSGIINVEGELLLAEDCNCEETVNNEGRDPFDSLIPYIISPRKTWLLDNKPALRWNKVPGATSYNVSIEDPDSEEVIWERKAVKEAEILDPGEIPLKPKVRYQLIVEASDGTDSLDEKVGGVGFKLLSPDEAQQVRDFEALLAKQGLTDEAQALLKAHFYQGYYLRADAIETLKYLADRGTQAASVYRLLGDLYRQVKLAPFAEQPYSQAVKLASDSQDLKELAAAQAGLGRVYKRLGKRTEAIEILTQALDNYKRLQDERQVREISKLLADLTE